MNDLATPPSLSIEKKMEFKPSPCNAAIVRKLTVFKANNEAADHIKQSLQRERPYIISFLNAHGFNLSFDSNDFYQSLLKSDIVLRDGVGMSLLYKALKIDPGANINGSDFIPFFIEAFPGKKIALLGTVDPYLENAKIMLQSKGYNVVLTSNGFHSIEDYLPLVKAAKADLIILGMGMPKQEQLSVYLKENLPGQAIIINGGAIIDLWGNRFKRAPKLVRRFQLEWLYRLIIEPKRLFSRYIVGNYMFLKRIPPLRKIFLKK